MAITAKAFSHMPENAIKKLINDLNAGGTTVKCALFTSAAAPNQETMNDKADVDAAMTEVANGNGYTTGGAALTTKAVTEATRVTKFDADDVEWTDSTITARYAVLYDDTGVAGTSVVLTYIDFGEDKSSESGTFKIAWNASGILTITVAA